ncbi:hypothetical protein TIFTF001_023590 [Ficus carica]|uniref:Uncharacterized protein n=1 Tax=Ficus carica TaxID=3494 RepID=A0AA88AL82_FICCA|nr:hypothetical protein TIFTF001_023590 [Ficus carica]
MHFRKYQQQQLFFTLLCHHFSTTKTFSKFPSLPKVHTKYRPQVVEEAQKALTEYLHTTRALPFTFAEHIGKNSLFCLCALIRRVPFSAPTFPKSFRKLLRYEPINEFEFFFESIGIDYKNVSKYLPPKKFFFWEDGAVLEAARELAVFGFPWNKLGLLYEEEVSVFSQSSRELNARLNWFRECYLVDNLPLVGVFLAFPYLLSKAGKPGGDFNVLFDDLKRIFVEFGMGSCVEGNVDAWYEICCKVRVFYDLGCGNIGELMCMKKEYFLECPKEVLVQKVEYFCKLGVREEDVGFLLLQNPEILNLDLETPVISVLVLLKHFGMSEKQLQRVGEKYPHVLGRNSMANIPHVMRAMDLNVWFFNKVKSSNHLLATCTFSCCNEEIDKEFVDALKRIESIRCSGHKMSKLDFLKGIGFGENVLTIKTLNHLHGNRLELQTRFDCLLRLGMKYSKICSIIRIAPKILGQSPEILEQKVHFLCQEMGSSLDYLDTFPTFLSFDLENRIKCRHGFYRWLKESGIRRRKKDYSIASMIATSEKSFVARLSKTHPAALKQYLECFSNIKPVNDC